MTIDYYAEAREVARYLDEGGHATEARSVIESIETGATGTEILMALRWNLEQLERANLSLSHDIRSRIRNLVNNISLIID